MVDWAKRIQKHGASALYPGEQIEAGTFVQPGGTLGRSVGGGVGGVVGVIAAEKLAKSVETESSEDGTGAAFPQVRTVLGLSSQRLLAFVHGSMSGKPKELLASAPLQDVVNMSAEKRKLSYALSIAFADGSQVTYEAIKVAKPGEFVAAFERLRG